MRDPDDQTAQQPAETLQSGPSRPPFFEKIPAKWRRPAAAVLAFALGIAAGGVAVQWWRERPAPQPHQVDEHAVELVLFEAVPPRPNPIGRESEVSPLQVDSAFLLSGVVASTVLTVDGPNPSLDVRIPALPVTVSPTARFHSVDLEIVVRDCAAARRWTPTNRPFTITWRDEYSKEHLDSAGDFDRSMANALTRYIDAVCGDRIAHRASYVLSIRASTSAVERTSPKLR